MALARTSSKQTPRQALAIVAMHDLEKAARDVERSIIENGGRVNAVAAQRLRDARGRMLLHLKAVPR